MGKMTPCLEVAGFPLTKACWLSSSISHGLEEKKLWIQSYSTILAITGSSGWQLVIFGILLVIKNHSLFPFQSSASCFSSSLKAAIPVQTSPEPWVSPSPSNNQVTRQLESTWCTLSPDSLSFHWCFTDDGGTGAFSRSPVWQMIQLTNHTFSSSTA